MEKQRDPYIEQIKKDIVFSTNLRGRELVFHSTWGLFSPRRIDDGSYLLTKHVELDDDDVTIDIGCGYGSIGVTIAACCPTGYVHMVDKDYVALEYARANAKLNGLSNCRAYASNAFSAVAADERFDKVVANLPAKVGKEMLAIILHDAHAHLRPGGSIYVVTVTGLRKFIRRNIEGMFGNYRKLKQGKHYTVAMAKRT